MRIIVYYFVMQRWALAGSYMVLCNGAVRIVRQPVIFQKSSDEGVHRRIRRRVSRFLAVQHGSLPMKYLGTMVGINQLRMSEFEPLLGIAWYSSGQIEYIWKATTLSMAGKLVLLKSDLQSIPMFFVVCQLDSCSVPGSRHVMGKLSGSPFRNPNHA